MRRGVFTILLLVTSLIISSCEKDENIEDVVDYNNIIANSDIKGEKPYYTIEYNGDARKTGAEVQNNISGQAGQAIAVSNNTLYRLFNTGICQTYNIADIDHPKIIKTFNLGAYRSDNHCNDAQFVSMSDRKILYIAGLRGKCYVEELTISIPRKRHVRNQTPHTYHT